MTATPQAPGEAPDLEAARTTYVDLLARSAMRDAVRMVSDLARRGVPIARIVEEVLAPAQVEVGRRWEAGSWSVAQEHTATGITEIALQSAVLASTQQPLAGDVSLVLACAEGEWHALSARMAGDVLRARGVDVTYVGASLPVESLGDYLELASPTALGLSCSTAMTLVGARQSIAEAHRVNVPVIVAGAAFGPSPRRADAIGADAWAGSLDGAADQLGHWAGNPPGRFASPIDPVTDEWEKLASAPSEWVDDVMRALTARRPRLATFSRQLLARLEKETAYLMRCCAGVLLTGDESMLTDYAVWMNGVLRSRRVPADVIDDLYASVAEALRGRTPRSAALVERAGGALRRTAGRPLGDAAGLGPGRFDRAGMTGQV
jgi:methanogenic corrinoid protein MtbC1